ncbi:MAG TPA: hypothetical protein PLK90_06560 [Clostridiales bacterium]|nr:hypothetical protein [Clostridiales bacterium]HQP70044.1 hypothetical protein [Clostridiales bacterium]
MIFISLLSALILIESREIFQGLLSQPFVTAVFLIIAGYDQYTVLSTAVLIHLLYLNRIPSGTAFHPEYPFGYFITVAVLKPENVNAIYFAVLIFIIMAISLITGRFIAFKRNLFEKHRNKFIRHNGYPDILKALLYSFSIFFIFALAFALILKSISRALANIQIFNAEIPHSSGIIITLCLLPAVVYAFKNIRRTA